ncbi:hypothetical protein F0562_027014 [Nyssa sinensis]|uniref:Purple acid phosphatase n=1 Tax=Nyssa sinensis TaxID=561372 RepID=A0A5J5B3K4_9ASTE|nr:hypothetical protein F0562_027014 [Nyssa sinensis]
MEWNSKNPSEWDWENLALFNGKAIGSSQRVQLSIHEIEGNRANIGSLNSSRGSGLSGSDLGHDSSSKSSISPSVDSSPKEGIMIFGTADDLPKDLNEMEEFATGIDNGKFPIVGASIGSGEPMIGLKLGKRTYFEDLCFASTTKTTSFSVIPTSSATAKRTRASYQSMQTPHCQVEGCNLDLKSAKEYHRRHRICESHSKSPKVVVAGMERRFCQQCSRFHNLSEFDDRKRSCRRRLSDHNARRRRPQPEAIQFDSAKLSSSLYDGRQQTSFLLNRIPIPVPNPTWQSACGFKAAQARDSLVGPAKSVGIDRQSNLSSDEMLNAISVLHLDSDRVLSFQGTKPWVLNHGLEESAITSNLDVAPDLQRACSLLSVNSLGLNEPEPTSLEHAHAFKPGQCDSANDACRIAKQGTYFIRRFHCSFALDARASILRPGRTVSSCPLNFLLYQQTGDFSNLPLLCHYPVKAQFVSNDPDYLSCKKKECKKYHNGVCAVSTCSGSLSFHVINIRTDIEFVFFAGGFESPCILRRSIPLNFANPKKPLYGHLSSIDSIATSMRLTWVSGDKEPQQVQYGDGKSQTSQVTTFSQANMCTKDFGWHDPGYIHSAVMTGLQPSNTFSYRYGSDSAGWSNQIHFRTPPAGGSDELKFLAFGDMGKAPRDASAEHYIQPGSLSVMKAMADEVASGNVDSIFHIGDISYATGFLVEWDFFLHLISPVASQVSYMTAIGNHERDYVDTGSVYFTPDSGGECGVPYETYFPMPTSAKDKPWYSIEQGSVHFTVISTEHDWTKNSEQYEWMNEDMASVDRSRTPWIIFTGHRPMYSSSDSIGIIPSVDDRFVQAVEPLLLANKVDLVFFGHVHNYERTCAVYQKQCKAMPKKDGNGIDVYDNSNYSAPVQAIIGMAGFTLDKFPAGADSWSLSRISEFGYVRVHATKQDLKVEYVNANTRKVEDSFRITKS